MVTAEQLAPFLAVSQSEMPELGDSWMDESFVRPVLDRFRGKAVLESKSGGILYHFQDLQPNAAQVSTIKIRPLQTPGFARIPISVRCLRGLYIFNEVLNMKGAVCGWFSLV